MNKMRYSYKIYPGDEAPPRNAEVIIRDWMIKHESKIPPVHRSDREFRCDLFLHDVKIREKLKEFIADIPAKEKLLNLFF